MQRSSYNTMSTESLIVRGCPISHFHCSRFHPTSRLELCSAHTSKLCSALKSELVGCINAPYKVNPNIFQFYFDFPDIFHHTSMHPLFRNIYEFYLIFYDFISLSILIPFGAEFVNTFLCIMPGVEIKAVYEIIVSHAPEQGICALNHTIPASPPQCLTVTEGVSLLLNS